MDVFLFTGNSPIAEQLVRDYQPVLYKLQDVHSKFANGERFMDALQVRGSSQTRVAPSPHNTLTAHCSRSSSTATARAAPRAPGTTAAVARARATTKW